MGFEPSLDPPTSQSLPPQVPVSVTPEPPSVPVQAPAPSVEVPTPAAEPATPQPAPEPAPPSEPAPAPSFAMMEAPLAELAPGPLAPQPPAPVAPSAPEPPSAAPTAASKGRTATLIAASRATPGRRALVGIGIAIVVLGLLGGIGYAIYDRFYADPLADAVAGHCLAGLPLVQGSEESEVSGARLVECGDPAATYLVQGRLDDVTEEQAADPLICRGFRHATEIYKAVPAGGTGYVLCLSRVGE